MQDTELLTVKLPKQRWAIEGIFPEGITVFAAPGKSGKSFFLANAAADVCYGSKFLGSFPVEQGEVLYIANEDSWLRLQLRLSLLLAARDIEPNGNLHFETQWPKADNGGHEMLESWLQDFPNARMVVIDVLRRYDSIRGWSTDQDFQKIQRLGDLASKHHVSIVAVHHTNRLQRKRADWTENLQGTMAVRDAAHCVCTLEGERGNPIKLFRAVGKDVADTAIPIEFDAETASFKIVQTTEVIEGADYVPISDERKNILEAVKDAGGATAPKIAEMLNASYANVRQLLWKMKEARQLVNWKGTYFTPEQIAEMRKLNDPQLSFTEEPFEVPTTIKNLTVAEPEPVGKNGNHR